MAGKCHTPFSGQEDLGDADLKIAPDANQSKSCRSRLQPIIKPVEHGEYRIILWLEFHLSVASVIFES